jgi:beta-aspartyl-peptidase (threonine type)
VDADGVLAAATSTGGVTLKMVGRVGDSPVPGAGNYACARVAASATGTGEYVLRSLATRRIAERVEQGAGLAEAVAAVLARLGADYDADVGLIAVDAAGTPVAMHRTRDMPHAFFSGDSPVCARMRV